MSNAPITWLPKSEPAYIHWLAHMKRYHFVDMLFLSWPGCELDSSEIDAAYQALQPLTERTVDGQEPWLSQLYSGKQLYQRLRQAPMELSHASACERLRHTMVGQDGQTTCIVLGLTMRGKEEFDVLLEHIQGILRERLDLSSRSLVFVGPKMEMGAINRTSQQAIDDFWLPSLAIGIVICFLFLRSVPLTFAVLAVALSCQGWALAIIDWLGGEINAVLIVLLPLSFVLAISSGIHLSNYYLDALKSNPNIGIVDILSAMRKGRLACILATVTTIIGLFSLWWVPLWPLQWFGTIGAFITAATLVVLWIILPGAMHLDLLWKQRRSRLTTGKSTRHHLPADDSVPQKILGWMAVRIQKHTAWVLFGFAAIAICLVSGVFDLKTTVSVERMLPKNHQLKRDYAWFESNIGPIVNAELEIEFPKGSIEEFHQRFELVRETHSSLVAADPSCGFLSAVTFVPELPQGKNLSAVTKRAVVRQRIENQFPAFQEAGFAARENGSEYWRINLRYPFHSAIDGPSRLHAAKQVAETVLAAHPDVRLKISGTTALAEVAQTLLFDGLVKSFLSTFILIWLAMLFMLRSISLSVLSILPNLFPFLTLFGALGLLNEPLDIGIVMAASVPLGIAVDDMIHFLNHYQASLAEGFPRAEAVHHSLRHCGFAMIQSTLICIATMFTYVMSDFVPTQRFAFLMCALLMVALIGNMVLLPALLWTQFSAAVKIPRR
ncbi:MAG: MMPL family transporter [Pirellulaceae bacterium]|nr:MMPL family transporter [Pirellulaceae bacterium]